MYKIESKNFVIYFKTKAEVFNWIKNNRKQNKTYIISYVESED